jgi:site-specific recombinase XerD
MMSSPASGLQEIFDRQIQILSLSRRASTMNGYRATAHSFLAYLRAAAPDVGQVSDLRRDPHLLGWFASLCEHQPPLSNKTRWSHLLLLRRLLDDLAVQGHPVPLHLILRDDFPRLPVYLPRALSSQDDQLLQDELRRTDTLCAHALRLLRLTGMRIGECLDLSLDGLRQIGPDVWALHIPLGKLHTERMFPADPAIRQTVARILALRSLDPSATATASAGFLLPRSGTRTTVYNALRRALDKAVHCAGCSGPVTPHPLRHTFASEMVRLGMSLPALMQLLGHKDIRMTLRYVQITQVDLHREYHAARRNAAEPHRVPVLSEPNRPDAVGPVGICQAVAATRHLLEMYRRQLSQDKLRRRVQRLDRRLLAVAKEVEKLEQGEK